MPVRRALIVFAVLLAVLIAGDQYLRARIAGEVERAAAVAFAASETDADVRGWAIIPQLLAGSLERVDVAVRDGVVGDPPIRVVRLDAVLEGLVVGFPPPAGLDAVEVGGGSLSLVVHEREVERLIRADRPGWAVQVTPEGVRAIGEVQGVEVAVTAEASVDGRSLRLRVREVDAGELGADASDAVAAAFDTTLPFEGVPDTIRFTGATTRESQLVIEGVLRPGLLRLGR